MHTLDEILVSPSRHNIQNTKILRLHIVHRIAVRNIVRVFFAASV